MLNFILIAIVIGVALVAVAALKPEWMRRAVEALIVAGAAVAAWEWDSIASAIKGIF